MATYSSEIETVLKRYIGSKRGEGRDRLRELLNNESVDKRYELLMNVREGKFPSFTGLIGAVFANDLESITYMLDGILSNQKCDVVKIHSSTQITALHLAASKDHKPIINYLLSNLSQQQQYDLLKIQNSDGNTPLHVAASYKKVEAVQAIISSVSSPLLIQLLNIKNNEGHTVTDIRPGLRNELTLLMSQGNRFCRPSKLEVY